MHGNSLVAVTKQWGGGEQGGAHESQAKDERGVVGGAAESSNLEPAPRSALEPCTGLGYCPQSLHPAQHCA